MIKISKTILPISCLCSVYRGTIIKEFIIAIDSLIMQDYLPKEIVIIVDGEIGRDLRYFIDNLIKVKEIFKVYFINKNRGLGFALKYGLPKCENEIVARFDCDDINLKNRLKIQYDFLKSKPEISIVGSDVLEFNNFNKEIVIKNMKNNKTILKGFMRRNPLNHPSVMFRKNDIIEIGSYRDIKFFEDYELWLRCIKKGLLIHNINKVLVAMRRENYLSKRIGFKYALLEIKFLKCVISQKTINIFSIPYFFLRILIRLLPNNFASLLKSFDSRRKVINNKFNLDKYIFEITSNKNSYTQKYKSLISK